jgi:parallel beta-helix repeat protein
VVDAAGGGDYTDLGPAVAAAPAGAHIYVKEGLYTINSRLSPATGVTITGAGYGAHVQAANGLNANVFQIESDYVTLESLRIDGNASNQSGDMNCVFFNSSFGRITGCFVHDANGYNIVGFYNGGNWIIEANHSYGTGSPRLVHEGIELQGVSYCTIVGNTVSNIQSNGILLWNSSGDCHHNTVVGNTVRQCGGAAIKLEDGAHDNTISGNSCDSSNWGIWLNNAGSSGAPKDNAVVGNTAVGTANNGIQLSSITDCVVTDNVLRDHGSHGIFARGSRGCAFNGNVVTSNDQAGIVLQDTSDCVCTGNICSNNGQNTASSNYRSGIVLYQTGGTCANNVVSGNRCFDSQGSKTQNYGIAILNSVVNTVLSGNLLEGNGSSKNALNESSVAIPQTFNVPYRRLTATVGSSQASVPHGLPYTPNVVTITMTSSGTVYKSAPADGTNVYLRADGPNRTAELLVG